MIQLPKFLIASMVLIFLQGCAAVPIRKDTSKIREELLGRLPGCPTVADVRKMSERDGFEITTDTIGERFKPEDWFINLDLGRYKSFYFPFFLDTDVIARFDIDKNMDVVSVKVIKMTNGL